MTNRIEATVDRPTSGQVDRREGGSARHRLHGGPQVARSGATISVGIVAILLLTVGSSAFIYEGTLIAVYSMAAIGQDWLIGRAGQISIGAAAFLAIGAFSGARVAEQPWGYFPLPLVVAAAFGGAVGFIVGLTGLRFRALYLVLSTLALQYIVSFLGLEYEGSAGALTVPPAHAFGLTFAVGKSFLIVEMIILAIVVVLLNGMYRRAPGRAWRAIAQNEVAAAVMSVNVVRWKLLAFVGSSAVTAAAGALLAYQTQTVSYEAFSLAMAISVLVMVFIGGQGSMAGAILGATLVLMLPFGLQNLGNSVSNVGVISTWLSSNSSIVENAIYGLALLMILLFERDGLIGVGHRVGRYIAVKRYGHSEGPGRG